MMYFIMLTNMLFLFMNHPMSMGLVLIIQTVMISMWSGMLMKTFWMSYILIITMLSGMLVLFIYMSSMASNEKFKNNTKLWMLTLLGLVLTTLFLFLLKKMIIKNNYSGMEMKTLNMMEMQFLEKMFIIHNMMLTMMLVIYLLYTMIVASFLVNISEGPMRMKN
nr:NADH dehydrogenase subunit 6 [Pilophorus typicus]